ncbi:FAD-dependent oxidoreductase [Hymenobacter taeanensis]|uniref:FAD-dependent oxidoreductase n=1 Tax=Hymenobacter taeanensis TaxID=2735321 RepID=A0A6M6BD14_9BACT|nr:MULTISPECIES: NAD(P)/FAD-dependent oxidoreductase [Hymenobacter]QJX46381.1 FAD-dependent oxidoreductase [Hymenobacter taeanensis]UOQ80243.1 NAD(P)/FAD-dependent oxidoreductase [Hymenobacter sp. 5414T-23]
MIPSVVILDAVVIGGGQTGLAAAYYLQQQHASYVVLDDRPVVGHVWSSRYESLRLFSPAWASGLPGLSWPGNPLRYPTKDEAAEYLRQYAAHFQLAVENNQRVTLVQPAAGGFEVQTAAGNRYHTPRVIVCTGPYTAPHIPAFGQELLPTVRQLHSSEYTTPSQAPGATVAVVGSGNSALQIAAGLATDGRTVYVAFDEKTPRMPNNTAMWVMLLATGLLQASSHSWVGRYMQAQPEPVVKGDFQRLKHLPNAHFIGRATATTAAGGLVGRRGTTPPLGSVVWATGFRPNYSWLQVPKALTPAGEPCHRKGISPVAGLAFLGLEWLSSRRSALMGGAAADARYVVHHVLKST